MVFMFLTLREPSQPHAVWLVGVTGYRPSPRRRPGATAGDDGQCVGLAGAVGGVGGEHTGDNGGGCFDKNTRDAVRRRSQCKRRVVVRAACTGYSQNSDPRKGRVPKWRLR